MPQPAAPMIYHIVHVDRLPSIIDEGALLCDAEVVRRQTAGLNMGTTIGMSSIKERRLNELTLDSHDGLFVGQCVPFYFCPRSIMLYILHRANHPDLAYHGGQRPIVHLEVDLNETVEWAQANDRRWAFTLSNAGAYYFEDRADLGQLGEIDWDAVYASDWSNQKEGKQAEFLLETSFPWGLVGRIGVNTQQTYDQVREALQVAEHRPRVEIRRDWYY